MKCCIMLSSKYSLNCCTCLIWFEFETGVEFELKTLEKINRKAIRNSIENRKAILAQVGPLGPSRAPTPACPQCLTRGSCLSAPTCALSPSLSRCSMGRPCRRCFFPMRALFLFASRTPSVNPLRVLNLSPTFPRRGRAHDSVFSGHLCTSSPL
jgi:hypothetical protein